MDSTSGNFVNARDRVAGGSPPCTVGPETGPNHYLGHIQFPPPAHCGLAIFMFMHALANPASAEA